MSSGGLFGRCIQYTPIIQYVLIEKIAVFNPENLLNNYEIKTYLLVFIYI